MTAGPYSIGSSHWPGISKLAEEAGEVGQVVGKLLGTGGGAEHWDGSNLVERLEEELADLSAAITFVVSANRLNFGRIQLRAAAKLILFESWQVEHGPSVPEKVEMTAGELRDQLRRDKACRSACLGIPTETLEALGEGGLREVLSATYRARQFINNAIEMGYLAEPAPNSPEASTRDDLNDLPLPKPEGTSHG